MKKLLGIVLCLNILLLLVSCNQSKNEKNECYVSSPSLIYGNRMYQIEKVETQSGDTSTYLSYKNIEDENGEPYIGCIDPLCTHDPKICAAYAYELSELVFIPNRKAPKAYFFTWGDNFSKALISLDMETGKKTTIYEFSTSDFSFYSSNADFMIAGDYVYINGMMKDGTVSGAYSSNIWRIPLSGGEIEQLTYVESGFCALYYCDAEGYFYYFHRDYENDTSFIARSKDFSNEERLLDVSTAKDYPKVYGTEFYFYGDMMYYLVVTAPMEYPMLEKPIGYDNYKEGYYLSDGYLSLYRIALDDPAEPELVAENIFMGLADSNIAFANGNLYCIPREDKLIGTIEWLDKNSIIGIPEEDAKKDKSKLCLCYIWSVNGGRIWEIDLNTLAKKEIALDEDADVHAIYAATENHVVLHIKSTDLDVIGENFGGSYTAWGSDMSYAKIIILELD